VDLRALRAARERFWHRTLAAGRCAGCGERHWLQAHHALPRQLIRRELSDVEELQWDERNGVCLCRRCHERHELAVQRLGAQRLPAAVREFASELDRLVKGDPFAAYLERTYK